MKWVGYPKYKESGVEWLGEVPEHWEVDRIDFLASVKARLGWKGLTASEYVDEGFVFLATPNIKGENGIDYENVNYITEERYFESPEIMLQENDVLIAKDGSTLGITNVVRSLPRPATVNSSIAVIRPNGKIDSRYLFRWLSSSFMQAIIESLKDGQGVPHLFQADIRKFVVLLPDASEQTVIADFLDRETGRIDTLTAKKRALIGLLKEKRTALISQTVTRGLPAYAAREFGLEPHTRFKDSGIEWFGNVPDGWVVQQLKWAVMFQRGHDLPADKREDGPIPLVSSAGVSASHNVAIANGPGIVTGTGIVTGRYGTIGKFHLIKDDYWPLNTTLYSIDLRGNNPTYLCYMLKHLSPLIILHSVKSAVPGVDRNDLHPTMVAVPDLPEQIVIATYLDRETAKIDKLIEKVEAAIERLQEYRTALITATVTGKIDVRNQGLKKEAA